MSHRSKGFVWCGLIIVVWGLLLPQGTLKSQASASPFTGIDVIFLVDQSGSMGGPTYGGDQVTNDPQGLRFQSMQYAMQWLGDFAHFAAPQSTLRISVIGFGDPQHSIVVDWTELSPANFTTAQWQTQKNDLDLLLSAKHFGFRSFGFTQVEDAFRYARERFDNLPPLPSDQRNIRAIVVITDGAPCAQSDCSIVANHRQLTNIRDFANQVFPSPDYQFFLILIETEGDVIWKEYGNDWEAVLRERNNPSHVHRVAKANDTALEVLHLLKDLRDTISHTANTFPVCQTLAPDGTCTINVPPYVRLMRINAFVTQPRTAKNALLTVTRADGSTAAATDKDVFTTDSTPNIETWAFIKPAIGTWKVQIADPFKNSTSIEVDLTYFQHQLVMPTGVQSYYQWQSVPIAPFLYFPTDTGTEAVNVDKNFPIDVTATVTGPNVKLTLKLGENKDKRVPDAQFGASFTPVLDGDYTVELVGQVPGVTNPDPQASGPFTPLDTRTALNRDLIKVKPAAVAVEMDPDLIARGGSWTETDPAAVCVIIQDPTSRQRVSNIDTLRTEVVLKGPDGSEQNAALTPQPDMAQRCSFEGSIAPQATGKVEVFVRGYLPKPDGTPGEVEVFNQTKSAYTLDVKPLKLIKLGIERPVEIDPTSFILSDAPLWFPYQPMIVSVTARDANDVPVDIGTLTGPPASPNPEPLSVSVLDAGGRDITGSNKLRQINASTYELRTYDYVFGTYTISVSGKPLNLRQCGCAYAPPPVGTGNQVQRTVNRTIPLGSIAQMLGTLLLGGVVVLSGKRVAGWAGDLLRNPVDGQIVFFKEYFDPDSRTTVTEDLGVLDLTSFNRHTFTVSRGRLIGSVAPEIPLQRIRVTNGGQEEWHKKGKAKFLFDVDCTAAKDSGWASRLPLLRRANSRKVRTVEKTLIRGADPVVLAECGEVRYFVQKDPAASYGEP